MASHGQASRFSGPRIWAASAATGIVLGLLAAVVAPAAHAPDGHAEIPLWLVVPFGLMLGSIAVVPFINARFWHDHFPDFAFFLGGFVVAYYLLGFGLKHGGHAVLHTGIEYYSFIALVGGLYVVSGGILVDLRGRGTPGFNTLLLAFGAVIANIVGTTGASMLLIRPFMRVNRGRLRPIHVVFFIFIVSNCGGLLTPIGDPPLYLGFLKGVPFFWTLGALWTHWIAVVSALLVVFLFVDRWIGPARSEVGAPFPVEEEAEALIREEIRAGYGLRVRGAVGLVCLGLMILGVFIDPMLKRFAGVEGYPIGATFQFAVAVTAYRLSPREIRERNDFSFFPLKEVGLIFVGIFATMMPALGYLATHGAELGLRSPSALHGATGFLSAVLDNAPTYLSFAQAAFADEAINPLAATGATEMNATTVAAVLSHETGVLAMVAISTAAVFFGAATYIGNGPNFMVKSIAEAEGVRMPSFVAYAGIAVISLGPILALHWLVFIH